MAELDWFDHKAPDYERVYKTRAERLERLRKDKALIPAVKQHYKDHPVDFINDWGMTFDPRNPDIGLPAVIPFILFKRQEEFIDWVVERWRGRQDGLAEKSRDMGVSWLCVGVAVWMFLFHPGTVVGFGSRKEEYVDDLNDPKSLFWKARKFIELLPIEFRPAGWNPKKHAPFMALTNPENGASIVGEAGDNIGRGNRTSVYFKDESAFYERPAAIDAALSQTSNCKIDISTPNGNGNPFFQKRHAGRVSVFTFHWTQDPRKDEAWYKKQCADLDPVVVAQEIDIDYNASVSDAWISGDSISAAQRIGPADIQAIGGWMIGVDAAHFGDDESVIHKRKGRLNLPQVTARGLDGVALAGLVEKECDDLVDAGGEIFSIIIELDGPGVSCFDQLKRGKYAGKVNGIHTGAKQQDNRNYNLKAKLWRAARDYLLDVPVSIPVDNEMKSQLASYRYKYQDGLLLMESKKDYKKRIGKSPDRADAFILTFGAPTVRIDRKPTQRPTMAGRSWMG